MADMLTRQQGMLEECYQGKRIEACCPEEQKLAELVKNDCEDNSRLQLYLRNLMAVMAFDVQRRRRCVTQMEMKEYTNLLARAFTEYMFYFIGHCFPPSENAGHYRPGAAHQVRDLAHPSLLA